MVQAARPFGQNPGRLAGTPPNRSRLAAEPREAVSFSISPNLPLHWYIALRYAATAVPRARLFFLTRTIGRTSKMDLLVLKEAIHAHRVYMDLMRHDPREASRLYYTITSTFDVPVVQLARCSSLIRHGLLTGSLTSSDYDVARSLCNDIPGAAALAPFFAKIERKNRWWNQG
ncbi:hypothetical protein GCM10010178_42470 [Lentzea flava]|uniref:Uncharacterized protein n=1 Tax=Lentzea flava TaxID=103732 RepID=A0ABQ2UPA5_9PSEU|nr:hypothetical protein GCM10010178_42470 [Lentzea flava]